MINSTDGELLGKYTASRCEGSFRELVERYIRLVYSSALRQVRDPGDAEDVSQAVFILLAKKAHTLRSGSALPAWLHSVTRFAARDVIKRRAVRQRIEKEAAVMKSEPSSTDWGAVAGSLDGAMASLGATDRGVLTARYLCGKSVSEVAGELSISEDATKKRLVRAMQRLRAVVAKRGFAGPGEMLEKYLETSAIVPAPAVLAETIASHALHPAAGICKSVEAMMFAAKAKSVASGVAVLMAISVFVAAPIAVVVAMSNSSNALPIAGGAATQPVAPPAPQAQVGSRVELANGAVVEVMGLLRDPMHRHDWLYPDGKPMEQPLATSLNISWGNELYRQYAAAHPRRTYVVAVKTVIPGASLGSWGMDYGNRLKNAGWVEGPYPQPQVGSVQLEVLQTQDDHAALSFEEHVACGPNYESLAKYDANFKWMSGAISWPISLDAARTDNNGRMLTIVNEHQSAGYSYWVVATCLNGGKAYGVVAPGKPASAYLTMVGVHTGEIQGYELCRVKYFSGKITIPVANLK
jgi:RNA polymerase sigma factor (sigma-70 family)